MARLSDVYYTAQNLDGVPEPPANPIPIGFYQGETIRMDVFLNYEDAPVTLDDWDIIGFVKTNQFAQDLIWKAELNSGLEPLGKPGFYRFEIPSETTAGFLAGTYWLVVQIKERMGSGLHDAVFQIVNQPFSVNYSAASPNPGTALGTGEPTYPPAFLPDK